MTTPPDPQPETVESEDDTAPAQSVGAPSLARLFFIWLLLGVQSFGGGVATLTLIRNAAVDRERWITAEEFARDWGLVQLAPGINLVALTILLGRRVAGAGGIAAALAGLLLPSAAITALLTALYTHIQSLRVTELALRGVIPATVGLGLVTAVQIVWPILSHTRREGRSRVAAYAGILAVSAFAALVFRGNIVWILLAGGVLGALAQMRQKVRETEGPAP